MPLLLLVLVVGIPLVVQTATVVLFTPKRERSLSLTEPTDKILRFTEVGLLACLFIGLLAATPSLQTSAVTATGAYAVLAARALVVRLISTKRRNERDYLLGSDWASPTNRGRHWQYEMKHRFVQHPEYIDELTLYLLRRHESFATLERKLKSGEFPEKFSQVSEQRAWGLGMPSTLGVAAGILPDEVFRGRGSRSTNMSADEVFDELKGLLDGPRTLLMDRLQYHWTQRNLDASDDRIERLFGEKRQLAAVVGIAALWLVIQVAASHTLTAAMALSAIAGASVFWLGYVGGGIGVFFLGQFAGTGTYAIEYPLTDRRYDRVWNQFLDLGVLTFLLMFIGCAIGFPLILYPATILHGAAQPFVIASLVGAAYCLSVFVYYSIGTHELMSEARTNALERLRARLKDETEAYHRGVLIAQFNDVRDLRVWPFDGEMLSKIALGICLPLAVQALVVGLGLG